MRIFHNAHKLKHYFYGAAFFGRFYLCPGTALRKKSRMCMLMKRGDALGA
jgi:hypothetical protein